jgi:hypothetical protein
MAKKRDFRLAPWPMHKKELNDYVLLTDDNKKNAMVTGRIIYVIDSSITKEPQYCGYKTFDPCFTQGLYNITLPDFWDLKEMKHAVPADMDKAEWQKMWVSLINDGVRRKRLYIKKNDQLIKYFKL